MAAFDIKSRMQYFNRRKKQEQVEKLRKQRVENCRLFALAGTAFERAKLNQQAASCFFTARSYSKAAELFKKQEMWAQAAECLACLGQSRLKEAARLFEQGGLVLRAIECLERVEEWEHLLHCLNRNQH